MTTKRVTPTDLEREIKLYNTYLQKIAYPFPYRNHANGGWQELQITFFPETSCQQIKRGRSRDCITALYKHYNAVYVEAMSGEMIITHVEPLNGSKRETGNTAPFPYKDMSAHQAARNIMLSCGLWQIWYTLNGAYFTQTVNQAWK